MDRLRYVAISQFMVGSRYSNPPYTTMFMLYNFYTKEIEFMQAKDLKKLGNVVSNLEIYKKYIDTPNKMLETNPSTYYDYRYKYTVEEIEDTYELINEYNFNKLKIQALKYKLHNEDCIEIRVYGSSPRNYDYSNNKINFIEFINRGYLGNGVIVKYRTEDNYFKISIYNIYGISLYSSVVDFYTMTDKAIKIEVNKNDEINKELDRLASKLIILGKNKPEINYIETSDKQFVLVSNNNEDIIPKQFNKFGYSFAMDLYYTIESDKKYKALTDEQKQSLDYNIRMVELRKNR